MKKIIKIFSRLVISLLILLALTGVFIQTPVFKGWVKNFLAEQVTDAIPGELSIGNMSGNLISHLEFEDICISHGPDTLLVCPELRIKFDLTALLEKVIDIQELRIIDPVINLRQDTLGTWNAASILSGKDDIGTVDTVAGDGFGYTILAGAVLIDKAAVRVQDQNDLTPEKISDLNLYVSGKYSDAGISVLLDSLAFSTSAPDFNINNISLEFAMSPDSFSVNNIRIKTDKNFLTADLHSDEIPPLKGQVKTELNKFDISETEVFFPGISIGNKPDIKSDILFRNDTVYVSLAVLSGGQSLSLIGYVANYRTLLKESQAGRAEFNTSLTVEKFSSRDWLDLDMPGFGLSGQVNVTGTFSRPGDLRATVGGNLVQLSFDRYNARTLDFSAGLVPGAIEAEAVLTSDYGDLGLNIRVTDPGNRNLFSGHLDSRHFALEKITGNDSLPSDLNFAVSFAGEGLPDELKYLDINLEMINSSLAGHTIGSLTSDLRITGEKYTLDSLVIQHQAADVFMSGKGRLAGPHDLDYKLWLKDPATISEMFNMDSLAGTGYIAGTLAGMPDSVSSAFDLEFSGMRYGDINSKNITGKGLLIYDKGLARGRFNLEADTIKISEKQIDKVLCDVAFGSEEIAADIDVVMDPNACFFVKADANLDSVIMIRIPEIRADVFKDQWNGRIDQVVIDEANSIEIKGCTLTSSDAHSISIEGIMGRSGRQNLLISLRNLDIRRVLTYTGKGLDFAGNMDFDLNLSGTASEPVIDGSFAIRDGSSKNMKFKGLGGKFAYRDKAVIINNVLNINDSDSLLVVGTIPFNMSFSDVIFEPQENADLDIRITSGKIPIGLFLNNISSIDAVSGVFFCDMHIRNKPSDLKISGAMTISDASLKSGFWGVDFQKMDMELVGEDNRFNFNRFQINRDGGTVDLSGEFEIDLSDSINVFTRSKLNLKSKNFYLVKHRDFEVQISSDINYIGQKDRPVISGELIINRSSFYLPVILGRFGAVSSSEYESKPLLVSALEKMKQNTQTTLNDKAGEQIKTPGFLDKLKGDLQIQMPRNTWVRNPQMRMELGGNLNLYLDQGEYLLSGPVEIVRGQYDILGRRFTVVEGKIDFQGRKDVSPPVSLEAEYTYRGSGRDKKTLTLKISGDLNNLIINFLENNAEISQEDAISIILFNRKKDELNFSSQTDMASSDIQSSAAMGIVSNLVSDRLSRKLGDNLKLDVIEVNAQDNWQSANFIVGKYITNDIFVTYKREFGQSTDNEIVPETISLEYEITKFLFFQMLQGDPKHSGIDLLFKFDID